MARRPFVLPTPPRQTAAPEWAKRAFFSGDSTLSANCVGGRRGGRVTQSNRPPFALGQLAEAMADPADHLKGSISRLCCVVDFQRVASNKMRLIWGYKG